VDVEDLPAQRGINVSYETVRRWCLQFGPIFTNSLRKRSGPGGDQWFVDEVFVRIEGRQRYLYRAVDQDAQVLDILIQNRRNTKAAARFFRRLLKQQGHAPRRLRRMRRFKSIGQAQLFLSVHGTIQNLFAIPRHLLRAKHYRTFRAGAFNQYEQLTCA
jgi:putative transposase